MRTFNTLMLPEITAGTVRSALAGLVYASLPSSVPDLNNLALVDDWLAHHAPAGGPEARTWALREVLTRQVTQQLHSLRQVWGYAQPADQTRTQALQAIQADGCTGNPEVIGWSWLYYRYIRVELGLSPQAYSQAAGLDTRSLRRYQQYAVQRLAQQLFQAEVALREREQQRHLRAALPGTLPPRLLGREAEISWLRQPQHVQITGPSGIGKTALVETVVHQGIAAGAYDHVIWLPAPTSLVGVRQPLHRSADRLVLIVDEGDVLREAPDQVADLLATWRESTVYLISPTYLPQLVTMAHLALRGLDQPAMTALVRDLYQQHHGEQVFMPDDLTLAWLWAESAGCPAAVYQQVKALWYGPEAGL